MNRGAFAEPGKEPPKAEEVERQIKEIEQLTGVALAPVGEEKPAPKGKKGK